MAMIWSRSCIILIHFGFFKSLQRLDIRGRIKILHGQNRKTEDPPLALFALCTPFGPPSLLEVPQKEVMFKSKHKLDLSLVSMDQRWRALTIFICPFQNQKAGTINSKLWWFCDSLARTRGKMLFNYADGELTTLGGYDLVHFEDLAYVASAHQER